MSAPGNRLRSQLWFHDLGDPDSTAIHIERYMNFGITREELQSGSPIIGIAQSGSDLSPCNRVHLRLAERVQAGIRAAGGVPLEFPVHPIQETGKRPTAALDRNLAYLGLVEVLHGYPIDGVVLTTGCDKTTPSQLMAAATVNIPAIVLSGGPMLDGWYQGKLVGSGTILWEARKLYAAGEIDYEEFIDMVASSAKSDGHCNTMGTASTMNSLAEALGMSLPGCAAIPAPYKERGQIAYRTGRRIVEMVRDDLTPSKIMTREAFENAIVANLRDRRLHQRTDPRQRHRPARRRAARHRRLAADRGTGSLCSSTCSRPGSISAKGYFRAGGLPAIMGELLRAGKLHAGAGTVNGRTVGENYAGARSADHAVIPSLRGPAQGGCGLHRAQGQSVRCGDHEDLRHRRNLPATLSAAARPRERGRGAGHRLRGTGGLPPADQRPVASKWMSTASSSFAAAGRWGIRDPRINMQPPDELIRRGIRELPTIGDGRQSGTSGSPSILNASPESAVGGGLAILRTNDLIRVDLDAGTIDMLVPEEELQSRREHLALPELPNHTPWQEIYRSHVGQLADGGVFDIATKYQDVRRFVPRPSH